MAGSGASCDTRGMWVAFGRLGLYLDAQARAGKRHVMLSFDEVEAILGRPLPPGAWVEAAWWANGRGVGLATARRYGWQVGGWEPQPDPGGGVVTFHYRGKALP